MNIKELETLGYDEWFRNVGSDTVKSDLSVARVIEVNKGNFRVTNGLHEMTAEVTGKFLFDAEDNIDFPTVGDWVTVQELDNHSLAIIHNVLPRKTLLKRKEPGKKVGFQLIASNIDCGLIVQPADNLNTNCLDRYLVMLNESKIIPVVIISKIDLLSQSELSDVQNRIERLEVKHVFISTISEGGTQALSSKLETGKTYCLLGPSGVGKTSLLNKLLGENLFRVNEIREKDGRGRHTTVRRQLIRLENGSIFIDTPGMRELGNFEVADGIEQTFDDISECSVNCRYRDCTHVHEEECAVKEAVEQGKIDSERYQNYLKIRKESEFYEMSYLEKKKKDKAFGKILKNYQKHKREND